MFKFIKKYAETMDHISIYPIISLLIFFIFFVVLLAYVIKLDKKSIQEISRLPLNDDTENNQNSIL